MIDEYDEDDDLLEPMIDDYDDEVDDLLEPMFDVIAAGDGGPAIARFKFAILPRLMERAANGDKAAQDVVTMVGQFSRLCQAVLDKKL